MMKLYEINLKRESYITRQIEADSQEEAEAIAWKKVDAEDPCGYAHWGVDCITEIDDRTCTPGSN